MQRRRWRSEEPRYHQYEVMWIKRYEMTMPPAGNSSDHPRYTITILTSGPTGTCMP